VDPRQIRVRFWASARQAAGTDELVVAVGARGARNGGVAATEPTVADVRRAVVEALPGRDDLPRVLGVCSVLIGDRPMGSADAEQVPVPAGVGLEFLPPFAGG
jgi:molybdopterin converting factor small subunit